MSINQIGDWLLETSFALLAVILRAIIGAVIGAAGAYLLAALVLSFFISPGPAAMGVGFIGLIFVPPWVILWAVIIGIYWIGYGKPRSDQVREIIEDGISYFINLSLKLSHRGNSKRKQKDSN